MLASRGILAQSMMERAMADGATPTLSPKEAIALGWQYFDELMGGQSGNRVLLEGLSLSDETGNWIVTFGFDSERPKAKRSVSIAALALGGVAAKMKDEISKLQEFELVREFRSIHLSPDDGRFVKLEHA
jgi:hypothetical protein